MKNRSNEPPIFTNREFAEGWRLLFGEQADKKPRTDKKPQHKPKEKPKEKTMKGKNWQELAADHERRFGEKITKIRGGLLIGPCYPVQATYDSKEFQQAFFRSKNASP